MDKIMIAIPTTDYIHARFIQSLLDLVSHLNRQGVRFEVCMETGTLVYLARNTLARKAVREEFTHVLWVDSDMVFQDDVIDTLKWCGKDIVAGVFQSRRPPFVSCLFESIEKGNSKRIEDYPLEPFKVAGCGFGCVFMKTEVIRAVLDKYDTAFRPTQDHGEDLAFCQRAISCGYEIWCEPTARIGHIAHVPVYPEDHMAAMKAREELQEEIKNA